MEAPFAAFEYPPNTSFGGCGVVTKLKETYGEKVRPQNLERSSTSGNQFSAPIPKNVKKSEVPGRIRTFLLLNDITTRDPHPILQF